MTITLPELDYAYDALEPHISKTTMEFHHSKHHNTYVQNTNKMVAGTELENASLDEIIKAAAGNADKQALFNNAAQAWNHNLFWKCMKPNGGGQPTGAIADKINADFGGYDAFVEAFTTAATTQFGSGWAWLAVDANGKLEIMKTVNADNPLAHGKTGLIGLDVWEHAYYLDYQNRRPDYIKGFLDNLVNWDFVNDVLAGA